MAVVGYATVQLIPSMKGFTAAANGQMTPVVNTVGKQAGKKAGGLFGGSFVGAVGKIMTAAGIYEIGSRITSGIGDAISTGIKGFANLQTYTISFKTLLGSAKAADEMIRNLYDFAAKTPFDVEGSVVGAQKLLGVGVAAKDVVPTLTTLGDATAALGGSTADFNSVLLAYSQIMARGKVSTQDLYQISNTGIPIFQLMSKALGKPVGEIQKLIETGNLASDDVLPKLLDQMNKDYGGAMSGQAETLSGLWSTFKDTMGQVLTQALTPVGEWLVSILPGATAGAGAAIDYVSDKFSGFFDYLSDPENKFSQTFQPLIDALQNTDWEGLFGAISNALDQSWQIIQPILEGTNEGLSQNFPQAVTAASDLLNGLFTPSVVLTGEAMNDQSGFFDLWMEQTNKISNASGNAALGLISIAGWMMQGKSATEIYNAMLEGRFGPTLQRIGPQTVAAGAAIGQFAAKGIQSIGLFVGDSTVKFTSWWSRTQATLGFLNVGGVTVLRQGMANWLATVVAGLAKIIVGISTKLAEAPIVVGQIVRATIAVFGTGLDMARSAGAALVTGFVEGIKSMIGRARDAAASVVSAVSNFFPHSPAPEGPFSGKGWTVFSGRSLVDGFRTGIIQRQGALRKTMANTFEAPRLTGLNAPDSVGDAFSNAISTSRTSNYIGAVNFAGGDSKTDIVDELNFYLRTLSRGGR